MSSPNYPDDHALETVNTRRGSPDERVLIISKPSYRIDAVGSAGCAVLPASIVYQTPGIRHFVRAEYAAYSSPNSSTIILSSAWTQSEQRIANAIKFDGPATQFGMTSACPMVYSANARYIGWRIRR